MVIILDMPSTTTTRDTAQAAVKSKSMEKNGPWCSSMEPMPPSSTVMPT